jgi:hypothetical protein
MASHHVDPNGSNQATALSNDKHGTQSTQERGGDAHDPELLALLRGVSNKSASADRFSDNDARKQSTGSGITENVATDVVLAAMPTPSNDLNTDVPSRETSIPFSPTRYGFQSEHASTFQGERGGSAQDAELLALLRGVSSKSSDRFGEEVTIIKKASSEPVVVEKVALKTKQDDRLVDKPWKCKPLSVPTNLSVDVVAFDPSPRGIASDIPFTYQGDRGGDAEDPELLALLRGVSNKSSVTDRFADQGIVPSKELLTDVPAHETSKPPEPTGYGIPSEHASTFQGERGGSAQDAELLALLRGVSSTSADRFGDEGTIIENNPVVEPFAAEKLALNLKQDEAFGDKPWKRKPLSIPSNALVDLAATDQSRLVEKVQLVKNRASSPKQPLLLNDPAPRGIQSEIPFTFQGDRGGNAEDAELLALLRGVSNKSAVTDRFEDAGIASDGGNVSQHAVPSLASGASIVPETIVDNDVGMSVTKDDLPGALIDKNWKVRSGAVDLLGTILKDTVGEQGDARDIAANSIIDGLDKLILILLADSNVNVLESALNFGLLYAEHCASAASPEQAARIVSILVRKDGLSSRPKTAAVAGSLALKLMEIGTDGVASVHSVVDILLNDGLSSKKQKVVQSSAGLILDAANEFGASKLPLVSFIAAAPKMLSHSNAKTREIGVKILAEICRSLGSKSHVAGLIEKMKKAQVTELDSLLTTESQPRKPQRTLRSELSGNSLTRTPDDALEALQYGTKELEAQRFAARPAVNLMEVISKTDYASRLALAKWSEKVAALTTVIECAGEKPYKLVPQSPSTNYITLITEMKRLLSHTHVAVVGKALDVLALLAEGVGETLYSYFRPMLPSLVLLTKDKKVTRSVASCLDSLFGNVLGFEHILTVDALPDSADEDKQKNALVRTSAVEFLTRCVKRTKVAGPRGELLVRHAEDVAAFCVLKTSDSNAGVRAAAQSALLALQASLEPEISEVATRAIQGLKSSNPRAYKAMSSTSGGPIKINTSGNCTAPQGLLLPLKQMESSSAASTAVKMKDAFGSAARSGQSIEQAADSTSSAASKANISELSGGAMGLHDALARLSRLRIPQLDAAEDNGGIIKGLECA